MIIILSVLDMHAGEIFDHWKLKITVIVANNKQMAALQTLYLVAAIACCINAQVLPIWSETPRIDAGDIILVQNPATTSFSISYTRTYNVGRIFSSAPTVGLSIKEIRIASNNGSISFNSDISSPLPTITSFINTIQMTSPTQIWYYKARYMAYDASFNQFTAIKLDFNMKTGASLNGINSSPGTARSVTIDTGITPSATTNIIMSTFLSGLTATVSSNFLQANFTELINSGSNRVAVRVNVAPDTVITSLIFYEFYVDIGMLQTRCWIFAESAITKAANGVQYTYFTPLEVNFAMNYISGLRAFSLINNNHYNFTIAGLNFTTFTNSYYNDVAHMNFWVRVCPSPYTFFNKNDYLCYTSCPVGTYTVAADSLCLPCQYSCATCSSATVCDTCPVNRVKVGSLCVCVDYYYELNQVCVACHYSCQTCTYSGQYFNCLTCDSAMKRNAVAALNQNFTCDCITGYKDNGAVMCLQICGDGKVYTDPCDDGNTADNDGCSSTCQIQTSFECDPVQPIASPPSASPSVCYFIGDISIDVVRIEKDPNSNTATFYLQITPFSNVLSQLTSDNMVTNISTAVFSSVSLVQDNLIAYVITYSADFEGSTIMFGIKPSLAYSSNLVLSRFAPKNDTLVATANNGLLLNAYSSAVYTLGTSLGQASFILGLVFLAFAFILCYGDWKEIGLQLFFSIQLCFMTFFMLPNHDPFITKLMYIANVMGWNQIIKQSLPPYHKVPVLQHMGYSVGYEYNLNLMAIFPGIALLLYLLYRGVLYRHQRARLAGQTTQDFEDTLKGKVLRYFKFDLFVYWMLFNMQQVLVGTVVQTQYIKNGAIFVYIVLCLIGILVGIVGLFIRPHSLGAYRQKLFHKSYGNKTFLMVLVSILIMDLLLLLSVTVKREIFYAMFVCPLVIGVYIVAIRPFKSLWNNVRLLIIQCCIIVTLALQVVIYNTDFTSHMSYPLGILVCMGVIVLVSLVVWMYDVVKKICKLRNKDQAEDLESKYTSQKEELSLNQQVREAGYALVNGVGGSRLPTVYEMSQGMGTSRMKRSHFEPLKSPARNNLKQFSNEKTENAKKLRTKLYEVPESNFKTGTNRSRDRPRESAIRPTEQEELRPREDKEKEGVSKRKRSNPYQQILNQTANQYI